MGLQLGLGFSALRASGGGAVPADYIITNDAEWASTMALGAATLSGKIAEVQGALGSVTINGLAPASALTIRGGAGGSIRHLDLTGTVNRITFSGLSFQMTGWPCAETEIVTFNTGTFDNFVFSGCSFRHGYGVGLANFDMTATYDEYARIDNVRTATTSSVTTALTWDDPAMTSGWVEFFNRGANTVYATFGGAGVTTSVGGGTLVAAGARVRFSGLNPTTDTHVAIITSTGTSQINARAEIGMSKYLANGFAASGSANIGRLEIRGCTFRDLFSAVKGVGRPTLAIVMDNDFDRIYADVIAAAPAAGGAGYILRNLLSVPFSRSGIAENLSGDAGDPHGDLIQSFGNASGTIGPIYIGGNRTRRSARRTGVNHQGVFLSDNDNNPSYNGVYSVSDMLLGGSTNGWNSGEASYPTGDVLVYGATILNPADLAGGASSVRLNTVAENRVNVSKTVAQNFTKEGAGFVSDGNFQINTAVSPSALFPSIGDLPTAVTRAQIDAAMTTAAEATGLGAVATGNAIDWTTTDHTAVILWENVISGVAWEDLTGQTIGATITLPLRKVLNRRANQAIVPGSGVEWRSTASDGTTEVQAWTTSSGTVQPDQFVQIRKAASASGLTAVDFDVTINGYLSRTVVTTTSVAPAIFHTQSGTGPYFVDPAPSTPTSIQRIEHEVRFCIPSAVTLATTNFITRASTGFDIRLAATNGGQVDLAKIEDGTGASMLGVTAMATNLPRDTWLTMTVDADQVAQTFTWALTGYAGATVAFTGSSNGIFENGRAISYFASSTGTSPIPAGIQIEYVETYFTVGGVRSLRKRIEGNAATVNADAWKLGTNAT